MVLFHLEYDYITLTLLNMNNFPMMAYVILSSTRIVERAVLWQLLLSIFINENDCIEIISEM